LFFEYKTNDLLSYSVIGSGFIYKAFYANILGDIVKWDFQR